MVPAIMEVWERFFGEKAHMPPDYKSGDHMLWELQILLRK